MKRALLVAALALTSGLPSQAWAQSGGQELIKQAVSALGGEPALRALKSVRIVGDAKRWEPDQALVTGGPALFTATQSSPSSGISGTTAHGRRLIAICRTEGTSSSTKC